MKIISLSLRQTNQKPPRKGGNVVVMPFNTCEAARITCKHL